MPDAKYTLSRRNFLKTAGLTGIGSVLAPIDRIVLAAAASEEMPTRPFGNSGIKVPILALGGSLDTSMSMLLLRQAAQWGVAYWDTAHSYMGGKSEKGMGNYFEKFPNERQRIFLVTKSHAGTLKGMSDELNSSLERLQTDYIDLFLRHSVRNAATLDSDIKAWAEKMKSSGKIRLFGFSTHSNMEACMLEAAQLGWIDGIMMSYNYRLMHSDNMRRAVDACVTAGIGLTAMKTQGGGTVKTNTQTELDLAGRFLNNGFTDAQAKLKAVWEHPHIASICSEMPNTTILKANVAAAMDKTKLSIRDHELLQQYAKETCADYCAGCSEVCESSVKAPIPIGDIMRYLMYACSYGAYGRARNGFQKISAHTRRQIMHTDYSLAEQRCPQHMAIGRLMRTAANLLA
jgi:uncharacterized protein